MPSDRTEPAQKQDRQQRAEGYDTDPAERPEEARFNFFTARLMR